MSSGSKGIPGVWKARTGKKGAETMMTELDKFKELTISLMSSEMRKSEWHRPCRFAFLKKASSLDLSFQRGVLQLRGEHTQPWTRLKRERLFVGNQRGALEL